MAKWQRQGAVVTLCDILSSEWASEKFFIIRVTLEVVMQRGWETSIHWGFQGSL